MDKSTKTIFLAPIIVVSILLITPIASQAQIMGTFSGGDGPKIRSIFVDQAIPIDPGASLWGNAPAMEVKVNGQNITIPILFNPTVKSINVKSMNNGTWIGFWLEWADPTPSTAALATHQFRDSIGVVFPATEGKTFIAMGGPGTPVNIMHWKADWQKDLDLGYYQDREDAYPNMAYDLYLGNDEENAEVLNYDPKTQDPNEMGAGDPRVHITELNPAYEPGLAAGNSLSQTIKFSPIEELVAEGFGTLTTQKEQNSLGKGAWDNGIWRVVMARPMMTKDATDAQFEPGKNKDIAFAVWDGGNMEVNGRKSVALWHNLVVEAGAPSAVVGQQPLTVTPPPAGAEGASTVAIAAIIGGAIVAASLIFYAAKRRAPAPTVTK